MKWTSGLEHWHVITYTCEQMGCNWSLMPLPQWWLILLIWDQRANPFILVSLFLNDHNKEYVINYQSVSQGNHFL